MRRVIARSWSPTAASSWPSGGWWSSFTSTTRAGTDYPGFGLPVLAPADGRIVEVADGYADTPPGTNGDHANNLVVDIGGGRYVVLAHLRQDSVAVQVGDVVRLGQPLAAVGNSGHMNEPHLHMQVQDSPTGKETPTAPTPWCSATHTSPGAVPGRWATAASFAPATWSEHSDSNDDNVWASDSNRDSNAGRAGPRHPGPIRTIPASGGR